MSVYFSIFTVSYFTEIISTLFYFYYAERRPVPLKRHIFLSVLDAGIAFLAVQLGGRTFLTVQYSQFYLFTAADQSDFFNSAGSGSASF